MSSELFGNNFRAGQILKMIRPDSPLPGNAFVVGVLEKGTTDKYKPVCVVFSADQAAGALAQTMQNQNLDQFELDDKGGVVSALFHVPVHIPAMSIKLD